MTKNKEEEQEANGEVEKKITYIFTNVDAETHTFVFINSCSQAKRDRPTAIRYACNVYVLPSSVQKGGGGLWNLISIIWRWASS